MIRTYWTKEMVKYGIHSRQIHSCGDDLVTCHAYHKAAELPLKLNDWHSLLLQCAFTIKNNLTLSVKYEMSNFVLAHIVVTLVIRNSLSQGKFLGMVLKKEPISSFKFYLHVDREINFYFNFFFNNGWELFCGKAK